MSDTEFLKQTALACAVCVLVLVIHLSGGLLAVIVAATLADCAIRRVEILRARRAHAPVPAEARPPRGM